MIFENNNRYYNDINTIGVNKLGPRSFFVCNSNEEDSSCRIDKSDLIINLNGEWKYKYYKNCLELEDNFFDLCDKKIDVPSCWQSKGIEKPFYLNVAFQFPCNPPYIPNCNPCVVYSRQFYIDDLSKEYILTFLGVSSSFNLYINNQFVGYSEGSHNTSEFDIKKYIKEGNNSITVINFKWCNGSYLEIQDMFRSNGIFRDVFINKYDNGYVYDYSINYQLKDNNSNVEIVLDIVGNPNVNLRVLYKNDYIYSGKFIDNKLSFQLKDVDLWSAECPNIYKFVFEIDSETRSYFISNIGFKTVEIKNGVFLFNNQKLKIFGVNHHDTNPEKLFALDYCDMERDIELIKEHNINTIRFSHYPPHPYMIELCDKYGIYVIDEADIESHGEIFTSLGAGWFSNSPLFKNLFLDRVERLYERDKNHPSIIMWSLGNESGGGENHKLAYELLKNKNINNIIHYEGGRDYKEKTSDVLSFMYNSPSEVKEIIKTTDRPVFLCEYCHAMGVGPGGLKEYINLFMLEDKMMGGCIWEWAEHAADVDGKLTYGGDNKEYVHDGNFCVDGMMSPYRLDTPSSLEIKNAYRPFISRFINNSLIISSRKLFSNSKVKIVLSYLVNGVKLYSKDINVKIKNNSEKIVKLPNLTFEKEYVLNVDCFEFDKLVGFEQFIIERDDIKYNLDNSKQVCVEESEREYIVKGINSIVKFDKINNVISSIKVGETEILNQNPVINKVNNFSEFIKGFIPNVYRYSIDNDRYSSVEWKNAGLDNVWIDVKNREVSYLNNCFIIKVEIDVNPPKFELICKYYITYTINYLGEIKVDVIIRKGVQNIAWLPRLGLKIEINKDFDNIEYYGLGPNENYIDFKEASRLGNYQTMVDEMSYDYIKPQESGERTECRRIKLSNGVVEMNIIKQDKDLSFNATKYNFEEFDNIKHNYELKKLNTINMYIDGFYSGVGTNACGPIPFEDYRIVLDADKKFSFIISCNKK